jgi:hypothetical protein
LALRYSWFFMSKRRSDANENNVLEFINISGPPKKRQRRVAQPVTEAMQAEAQRVWQEQHQAEAAARMEFTAAREREAEAERHSTSKIRVGHVLQAVKAAGYGSLYGFLDDLVTTKDQDHSSQVSQMLISHGDELLDSIRSRQPEVVSQRRQCTLEVCPHPPPIGAPHHMHPRMRVVYCSSQV